MSNISYIGDTDLLYILNKLKTVLQSGYVPVEAGKGLSTEDFTTTLLTKLNGIAESADAVSWNQIAQTGTKIATVTINGTGIDILVPPSTSITVDTEMSDVSENPVQNKVIKQYVDDAIDDVVGVEFRVVTTLPATGEAGVIYLVPNGGTGGNTKDEYIWITSESRFEKIGTTDIDLSGYVQKSELVEVTTSDIDTMFQNVFGN